MLPRTQAFLISLALIVGLGGWFTTRPGDFSLFSPGPTVDLLASEGGEPIIDIEGRKTYRDDGELRLVTIRTTRPEDKVGLWRAIQGWLDPDVDVYPYAGLYNEQDTNESNREALAQQMTSSQDAALAAALTELGIEFGQHVEVMGVKEGGPSDGVLKQGDRVVSVQGKPVNSTSAMVEQIQGIEPGTEVEIVVRRGGAERTFTVTTAPAGPEGEDARKSIVGVTIGEEFDFPVDLEVGISDAIGGPSAGMMFALTIVDVLTPGSLTGGKVIAGTGEISVEGEVGSIGGVRQKIAGAEADGAELFLVPAANCDEAVLADYDEDKIQLVRVATLDEATAAIKAWVQDPEAELPQCSDDNARE